MKRKIWIAVCACLVSLSVSGCVEVTEMTEDEQEVIAEYAASSLLNYDRQYNAQYNVDVVAEAKKVIAENQTSSGEPETEKPEKTAAPEKTETPAPTKAAPTAAATLQPTQAPTTVPAPTEQPVAPTPEPQPDRRMAPYDIGKLFGIEGIEVNYIGFEGLDSYPVVPEDKLAFTMKANSGAKLVVVKFELSNHSGSAKTCNIVGQNIKFQMRFNDTDFVGVQKTLLTDDFASLNCVLQPEETRQVVVISQVTAGYETSISSVDLIARIGGENTMIKLQ